MEKLKNFKMPSHKQLTNAMFMSVILIASFASLVHVKGFWLITNNEFWATSLAVSTGLGIIGSMMAMRYSKWTIISFFVIVVMELIGNIYHAFAHVDVTSQSFILFKQLTQPLFEMIYLQEEGIILADIVYMRWIAILEGAFIPLLVVIMFHIWTVVYDSKEIVAIASVDNEYSKVAEEVKKPRTRKNKTSEESVTIEVDPLLTEEVGLTVEEPIVEFSEIVDEQLTPIVEEPIEEATVEESTTSVEEPIIAEKTVAVEPVENNENEKKNVI